MAIIDEYHEHQDSSLYDTMISGMGARTQPLILAITTAGFDIAGPCYAHRERCIEMLEGTGGQPDDELFALIYTIDPGDDWTSEAALLKANPNADVSVGLDWLKSQIATAVARARTANRIKTKHLNVWVSSKEGFYNMESWRKCEDLTLSVNDFRGVDCYYGFDLARKLDLTGMVRVFVKQIDGRMHYYCVSPTFWVPEDTVFNNDDRRTSERYKGWVEAQKLESTDGAEIDYREVLAQAKEAHLEAPAIQSGIDPHGAANLSHQLDDAGLNPVTIQQGYKNLSDPMKELEAAILTGRFHHDGHPIMTWCVGNVVAKYLPGNDDVMRPIKQGDQNKIDGAVALIIAIGRAMVPQEDDLSDHLEEHGIRTL